MKTSIYQNKHALGILFLNLRMLTPLILKCQRCEFSISWRHRH